MTHPPFARARQSNPLQYGPIELCMEVEAQDPATLQRPVTPDWADVQVGGWIACTNRFGVPLPFPSHAAPLPLPPKTYINYLGQSQIAGLFRLLVVNSNGGLVITRTVKEMVLGHVEPLFPLSLGAYRARVEGACSIPLLTPLSQPKQGPTIPRPRGRPSCPTAPSPSTRPTPTAPIRPTCSTPCGKKEARRGPTVGIDIGMALGRSTHTTLHPHLTPKQVLPPGHGGLQRHHQGLPQGALQVPDGQGRRLRRPHGPARLLRADRQHPHPLPQRRRVCRHRRE